MSIREAELIRNARKPFELNYSEGDDVTILTDSWMDPTVWNALTKAARSMEIRPTVVMIPEPERTYADPPKSAGKAVQNSDLTILATSKGTLHSDSIIKAAEEGTKVIALSEATPETLAGGAASADYDLIADVGDRIAKKFANGNRVEIITSAGVFEASIEGQKGSNSYGKALEDVNVSGFPGAEVALAPKGGTANGKLTWNVNMHEVGPIKEPIQGTFENGYLTEIEGGAEADRLQRTLEATNDPESYNVAEIAVQTNPDAQIRGQMRTDKKKWGYIHVAVGSNHNFPGGEVHAPVHLDGVIRDATLKIDDETIVENNDILV